MIAEFGHFALILAFTLSLAQSVVPLFGAHKGDRKLMEFGSALAHIFLPDRPKMCLPDNFVHDAPPTCRISDPELVDPFGLLLNLVVYPIPQFTPVRKFAVGT